MSHRLLVLAGVKALVQRALPGATVRGMANDDAKPERTSELGDVIIRSGDPGQPDIDLSPPVYWWDHSIPIELAAYRSQSKTSQEVLDDMLVAIGTEIVADRTLGGLCQYLDAEAPTDGETTMSGAATMGWADFAIVATYSTSSPLG